MGAGDHAPLWQAHALGGSTQTSSTVGKLAPAALTAETHPQCPGEPKGLRALQRLGQNFNKRIADEDLTLLRLAASCALHGTTICFFGMLIIQVLHPMPDVFPKRPEDVAWPELMTAVAGGLWLANLAVLWRTATR
jgi:hypothetical protein